MSPDICNKCKLPDTKHYCEREMEEVREALGIAMEALVEIGSQPDFHPLAAWSHERARKAWEKLKKWEAK